MDTNPDTKLKPWSEPSFVQVSQRGHSIVIKTECYDGSHPTYPEVVIPDKLFYHLLYQLTQIEPVIEARLPH